jgi:hypothetical protein
LIELEFAFRGGRLVYRSGAATVARRRAIAPRGNPLTLTVRNGVVARDEPELLPRYATIWSPRKLRREDFEAGQSGQKRGQLRDGEILRRGIRPNQLAESRGEGRS